MIYCVSYNDILYKLYPTYVDPTSVPVLRLYQCSVFTSPKFVAV